MKNHFLKPHIKFASSKSLGYTAGETYQPLMMGNLSTLVKSKTSDDGQSINACNNTAL